MKITKARNRNLFIALAGLTILNVQLLKACDTNPMLKVV